MTFFDESKQKEMFGGIIANNEDEIVKAISELYSNEELWNEKAEEGRLCLSNLFDQKKNSALFSQFIHSAQSNLPLLRKANLFGNILWHSSNRYTQIFSKYIQLKESQKK